MASIYEVAVDPGAENDVHATMLDLVGYNKRVLEVGCSSGYFTKALADRGCEVVGIELDPETAAVAEKWAEEVVVGDLESETLWPALEGQQFDVVTFGDVLEHLRDPLATLRLAVRHLKPSGTVVISVPNIAHGDVRMALLQGNFPYRDTGITDRTHLRFFTKDSLRDLIEEAGLALIDTRRIVWPLFQTLINVKRETVDQTTINLILEDAEAETYQFVVKAILNDGTQALAELVERVNHLSDLVQDEVVRTALLHKQMNEVQAEHDESHRLLHEARLEADGYRVQYEAVINTKAFRLMAPWRRLYGSLRRRPQSSPSPDAP